MSETNSLRVDGQRLWDSIMAMAEIGPGELELEPSRHEKVAGRRLPMGWRIRLPTLDRELTVEALHPDQWMEVDFPYWEGAVTVSGDSPGERGVGYMELTGYPESGR